MTRQRYGDDDATTTHIDVGAKHLPQYYPNYDSAVANASPLRMATTRTMATMAATDGDDDVAVPHLMRP